MRFRLLYLLPICFVAGCADSASNTGPLPPALKESGYSFIDNEASKNEANIRARTALINALERGGVKPKELAPFLLTIGFATSPENVGTDENDDVTASKGIRLCKAQTSRMTLVVQDKATGFRRYRGQSAIKRCKPADDKSLQKMADELVGKMSAGFVT